jgi:hypothetical protein
VNEPLGIALELAERRKALAKRMSPLARRLAFPELYDHRYAPRRSVKPRIFAAATPSSKTQKALAAQPQATVIVEVCAAVWGVPHGQIYDYHRSATYARPRQAAMSLLRDLLELSLPVIGVILNRDHTTCLAGHRKHWEVYALNSDYAAKYDAAEAQARELLRNAATSDTAAAGGQVDGCTEQPSHLAPAKITTAEDRL